MEDPARKTPLDPEETARLASGADRQFYASRTPGLARMSSREVQIIIVVLVVICVPLYIHLDIAPFLPFEISPEVVRWLTPTTFAVTALAGLLLLIVIVATILSLIGFGLGSLFPSKDVIACHPCGAKITLEQYTELQHCPNCASNKVYCANCGRASVFAAFMSENGCEHCDHPDIALKK